MNSTQTFGHERAEQSIPNLTPIVFVVDDDIAVRESPESLIRCEGWQTETFQSAREFLSRPRPLVPSCLILDLSLPDLNGLELQKMITRERAEMPIIFISTHEDVPITVKAMKAGPSISSLSRSSNEALLHPARRAAEPWREEPTNPWTSAAISAAAVSNAKWPPSTMWTSASGTSRR
jgi:FixJ family two-component response regulator